jgi:hypothetical protein
MASIVSSTGSRPLGDEDARPEDGEPGRHPHQVDRVPWDRPGSEPAWRGPADGRRRR